MKKGMVFFSSIAPQVSADSNTFGGEKGKSRIWRRGGEKISEKPDVVCGKRGKQRI